MSPTNRHNRRAPWAPGVRVSAHRGSVANRRMAGSLSAIGAGLGAVGLQAVRALRDAAAQRPGAL